MIWIYAYLFARCLKRVGPIVDVVGVPVLIGCELLIEGLHEPALANAGLGNNERHARTVGESSRLVAGGAVVPKPTQPR